MRSRGLCLLAGFVLIASLAGSARGARLPVGPPVERTLDNGLRVLVLPQHRMPIVQIQLLVPGGSAAETPGHEGVALLTAQMLRRGTTSRSAEELAAAVDRLGGTLTCQATREYSTVNGAFLARDLEAGLELMSSVVLDPLFPDQELRGLQAQAYRAVLQVRGTPALLADDRVWGELVPGHPYAHSPLGNSHSLAGVSHDALRDYYRDVWRPDHAVLAIAGDVDPERAFGLAASWFGRWAGQAVQRPVPALQPLAGPRLDLIDEPGMSWAEVRLALVMPGKRDADEPAATLAAGAFAAGTGSRLSRVRGGIGGATPRGSLYTLREGGLLVVSVAVPADSAAGAVRRLRAELRAFVQSPPAEAELEPLRRASVAAFPLAFESLAGALTQWQTAGFDGIAPADLEATPGRIAALHAADVAAAIRRWFDPEHALVLVVGDRSRLAPRLAAQGPVAEVPLETFLPLGTAVADTLTAATPERVARGRALVQRALEAHGGLARLRDVHDSSVDADLTMSINGQELATQQTQIRKEPFQMLTIARLLTIETRQGLQGRTGWVKAGVDSIGAPVDSTVVHGMRLGFLYDLPHLLLAAADTTATVVWRGPETVNGAPTQAVEVVSAAGDRRRYHFDATTGRLAEVDQYASADPVSPLLERHTYSDYHDVGGIQWPFREERTGTGDNTLRVVVKSVRLNQGVRDDVFNRPVLPSMPGR